MYFLYTMLCGDHTFLDKDRITPMCPSNTISRFRDSLIGVIKPDNIVEDTAILESYARDISLDTGRLPTLLIYPESRLFKLKFSSQRIPFGATLAYLLDMFRVLLTLDISDDKITRISIYEKVFQKLWKIYQKP